MPARPSKTASRFQPLEGMQMKRPAVGSGFKWGRDRRVSIRDDGDNLLLERR